MQIEFCVFHNYAEFTIIPFILCFWELNLMFRILCSMGVISFANMRLFNALSLLSAFQSFSAARGREYERLPALSYENGCSLNSRFCGQAN